LYHISTGVKIFYTELLKFKPLRNILEKIVVPLRGANQIQAMFNAVAPNYDFLNRLLSAGYDKRWRKLAVNEFGSVASKTFLDVATVTADIALEMASRQPAPHKIIGMDFSQSMLKLGIKKFPGRI
jgi:ubiquinone/menaquinone biosynthesis C-methylase UbiE